MANWKVECKEFSEVRRMICDEADGKEIMQKLHEICAKYCMKDWEFAGDFEDLGCEIWDAKESGETEDDDVNYYLGEFYDLCDAAGVWLPF